jgi:hypothetical protein
MRQNLVITTATLMLLLGNSLQADESEEREKAFSTRMSNVTLVGSFTVDGRTDGPPKAERYEIKSVTKLGGNLWTFVTRVKYGNVDTRIPITVPLEWAGDTPMVSLTDATLPGLGSAFSARVIFHGDRYAGTWQHGKVGGHMFGRIEKTKPQAATESPAK